MILADEEARAAAYRQSLVNRHNAYVTRARKLAGNMAAYADLVARWMPARRLPLPPPQYWEATTDQSLWDAGEFWRDPPPDWSS